MTSVVAVLAPDEAGVLTPEALELVAELEREFGDRRRELLRARAERQERILAGESLGFLEETRRCARATGRSHPCRPRFRIAGSRSQAPPGTGRW